MEDKATKEQWNSAKYAGISLIAGIAVIAGIAQSVPVWISVLTGLVTAAVFGYFAVRFIKRTF